MSSDSTDLPPSSSLVAGKYELCGLIGRGGMGAVYEGRHVSLGTPVAIKFIDAECASSAENKHRFDNEARAAATIQSRHAIQIYDHGVTDDGRPYIVMELLVGEALDKRMDRTAGVPLLETARIVRQVAKALARAHEHGIIHRDLKPENIFLVRGPDDEEDVAKVLDFGIAKIKASPGSLGVSSGTKTGTLLGTPFYMSPEQARGLKTLDHRSDLWSLGVIVYKCVTGALPFDGESLGDLLVKICTSPLPPPSSRVAGLPPGLDAWMARALEREPAERFQSATELAEALAVVAGLAAPRSAGSTPEVPPTLSSPYTPRAAPVSAPGSTERTPFTGSQFSEPIVAATSAGVTASAPQPIRRQTPWRSVLGGAVGLVVGVGGVLFILGRGKPEPSIAVSPPPPAVSVPAVAPPPASSPAPAVEPPPAPLPPLETASAVPAAHGKPPVARPKTKTAAAAPPPAAALPAANPVTPAPAPAPPAAPTKAPSAGEPGY